MFPRLEHRTRDPCSCERREDATLVSQKNVLSVVITTRFLESLSHGFMMVDCCHPTLIETTIHQSREDTKTITTLSSTSI